jgi:hypothetical protein
MTAESFFRIDLTSTSFLARMHAITSIQTLQVEALAKHKLPTKRPQAFQLHPLKPFVKLTPDHARQLSS